MRYRFTSRVDHADLASGRVLRSVPGRPAFPVRLASELFQQALADLGSAGRVTVLDPLAGVAYLLTVVGMLHGDAVLQLLGLDIDPAVEALASANLALTTPEGLADRTEELRLAWERFGNPSHHEALESARRLGDARRGRGSPARARFAVADAFDADQVANALDGARADLVLTDVPYGRQVSWSGGSDGDELRQLLAALRPVTTAGAVAAIATPKTVRLREAEDWTRIRHVAIGHRRVHYFRRG